jgi:hypothetical protein
MMFIISLSLSLSLSDKQHSADNARLLFSSPHGDHFTLLHLFQSYEKEKEKGVKEERREWCRYHSISEKVLKNAE